MSARPVPGDRRGGSHRHVAADIIGLQAVIIREIVSSGGGSGGTGTLFLGGMDSSNFTSLTVGLGGLDSGDI